MIHVEMGRKTRDGAVQTTAGSVATAVALAVTEFEAYPHTMVVRLRTDDELDRALLFRREGPVVVVVGAGALATAVQEAVDQRSDWQLQRFTGPWKAPLTRSTTPLDQRVLDVLTGAGFRVLGEVRAVDPFSIYDLPGAMRVRAQVTAGLHALSQLGTVRPPRPRGARRAFLKQVLRAVLPRRRK